MKSITYAEFFKGSDVFNGVYKGVYNLDDRYKPSELWLIAKNDAVSKGHFDSCKIDVITAMCQEMCYSNFVNDLFEACVNALSSNEEDIAINSQEYFYVLLNQCISNKCLNKVYDDMNKKILQYEMKNYDYDNIVNCAELESFVVTFAKKYFNFNETEKYKVLRYYGQLTDKYGRNLSLIKKKFKSYVDTLRV